MVARHLALHVEAFTIATLIDARRYDEAAAAIGGGIAHPAASSEVGTALIGLKRAWPALEAGAGAMPATLC